MKPLEAVKLVRAGLKALRRDGPQGGQILQALWARIDALICTPLQAQQGDNHVAASLADFLGVALETLGPAEVVAFAAVILDKLAIYLGAKIWSAPLRTLTQLLATLMAQEPGTVAPQVWTAVSSVLDQIVRTAATVLREAKQGGHSLETEHYEALFGLLKQVAQCPPLDRKGADALWLRSGWELMLLAVETPIEVTDMYHCQLD